MRPTMRSKFAFAALVIVGFGLTLLVYNFWNQEIEAIGILKPIRRLTEARSFYKMNWSVTKVTESPESTTSTTNTPVTKVTTSKSSESKSSTTNASSKCSPITQIVYLKTHKTGSSTTASIFQRFGYHQNLLFAFPKSHKFSLENLFSSKTVQNWNASDLKNNPKYNMLVNHARYNRLEMDKVVPNATFVTMLRDPVLQLESAFGYFEMARGMGLSNESNPFETFVNNSLYYYTAKKYRSKSQSKIGQLFDLGFDQEFAENITAIHLKIDELDKDFDLVMITDYFHESLILLKKLLCWSFDDILYISNGIRSQTHRYKLTDDTIGKIRRWNAGDVLLYDHFNRSFWRKVREYGSDFYSDLEKFRKLEKEAFDECVAEGRFNQRDQREDKFVINPEKKDPHCQDLIRNCPLYTDLLKQKMKKFNESLN